MFNGIESWGGPECTVNRVRSTFFDQLQVTGHHDRFDDYCRIAALGFDRIRFPILWERLQPDRAGPTDWEWTDVRLKQLQDADIVPIAGLLHHGSGPAWTSLVDPDFPAQFASYATRVARRYPWITDWTPINEPLTTARFSALYGLWYPHARDERLSWLALLNQIDGIRLGMRAIRREQPEARLIQTEDLGRTYATADLTSQAAHDNQRRWLTWDLLCGRVDAHHPMASRIDMFGFAHRREAISADPCAPAILGVNHYLTSDRFLDSRLTRYPVSARGRSGDLTFADVEAVRVLSPAPQGLTGAVEEIWNRYQRPLALTEVHNGCTREEQVRWLEDAWTVAMSAKLRGIDVRAVTAWALFGNQGWNTLLTRTGEREVGAFDISSGTPRPTALARAIANPADGTRGAAGTGWWRRDIRLAYPPVPRPASMVELAQGAKRGEPGHPVLILGATGTLGRALDAECRHRDIACVLTDRERIDLLDCRSIERGLDEIRPWAVLNAAGWVRVDDAEDNEAACHAVNAQGAIDLATLCSGRGIATINFSSDLAFNGLLGRPYCEEDKVSPLGIYGRSKAAMEAGICELPGQHLIVRTAAFFSPFDSQNFAAFCLATVGAGQPFVASAECVVSPTYTPDLCRAVLDLLIDGESGLWHLTNGEAVTWHEFALRLCEAAGLDTAEIVAGSPSSLGWRAPRPSFAPLASERGQLMPTLDSAIDRCVTALKS